MEDLQARHKKEIKALDGAKRAAVKKIKTTLAGKSKKGKDAVAVVNEEYATKEKEMIERHFRELEDCQSVALHIFDEIGVGDSAELNSAVAILDVPATNEDDQVNTSATLGTRDEVDVEYGNENRVEDASLITWEKKQAKARRKKERVRERERERESAIEEEISRVGPSARDVEISRMTELYLNKDDLVIAEVAADGHCLYRAVAAQYSSILEANGAREDLPDYEVMRALCADKLASAEAEYSPFAECGDISYEEYVKRVKSSAQWGGQLELRALSSALNRPIVVYSADTAPLTMDDDSGNHRDDKIREPILLSFHRHYFALGEHYNFLVRKDPRK